MFPKRYFASVPSPNEWLAQIIEKHGVSGNSLARTIGQSAPQVNRWINKKEKIPRHHLMEIAQQIGIPSEFEYINQLKTCEEIADQLQKLISDFAQELEVDGDAIETALFKYIEDLALKEASISSAELPITIIARFTTDAYFALRLGLQALRSGFVDPLIDKENINRHLKYPVNQMFGFLLDISSNKNKAQDVNPFLEFQHETLLNLKKITEARNLSNREQLINMHALHLLSRYGQRSDRGYVESLVYDNKKELEPLTKRLSFVGLILGQTDVRSTDLFLRELRHDTELAAMDILFDALHYGDITLSSKGDAFSPLLQYSGMISHVLYHIQEIDNYKNILPLEVYKLTRLLNQLGPKPFLNSTTMSSLDTILEEKKFSLPNEFRTIQINFEEQFARLIADKGANQGFLRKSKIKKNH